MSGGNGRTWCSACEEECPPPHHLDAMCLTCGEELTTRPGSRVSGRGDGDGRPEANVEAAIRAAAASMGLPSLGGGDFLGAGGVALGGGGGGIPADLAALLPPEALDPQAGGGGGGGSRPASNRILEDLSASAKVLDDGSAELHAAGVVLCESRSFVAVPGSSSDAGSGAGGGALHLNAIPGEFVPLRRESDRSPNRECALLLISPRTVKNGELSSQTTARLTALAKRRVPFVAYVERGDGVTFAKKALVCKRAGERAGTHCAGVVVGNTPAGPSEVWPYAMKDSKGEATKEGLDVPVVMIRNEDGKRLVRWASSSTKESDDNATYVPCAIRIRAKDEDSRSCPVCTDSYRAGAKVVRLPLCGHVFHETCARMWLTRHNTCPYCRRELPTDDEEYEAERRRVARTHAGSSGGGASSSGGSAGFVDFYG